MPKSELKKPIHGKSDIICVIVTAILVTIAYSYMLYKK